jgi:Asp-tRNA(Asn)/Glu-tRNA(Gln) amidotransferase A subunit family amidase
MKKYYKIVVTIIFIICFARVEVALCQENEITSEDIKHAQKLIGIEFTQTEIDSMLSLLADQKLNFENMRKMDLPNSIPPAYEFNPIPVGKTFSNVQKTFEASDYSYADLPADMNDLAFYSVGQLAELLKSKKITSVELTKFFLDRLKKYAPMLHCVITFTDSLAMIEARIADEEIASGNYKGMLHGIPFGIKDMFATKNYRTTFGTPPFEDQMINEDATIVKKLRNAGAVMLGKLSLGELAMDDVWFEGQTRNPWDTSKGSSGSSAGPAASVSAGLVPFAIGSETWGSIVSPSTVCGVTGLRPTFGRVSRYGAMALSWTMDKVGPICRNVEDCAIVLNSIYGVDGKDQTVAGLPFNYSPEIDLKGITIGYIKNDFDQDTANKFLTALQLSSCESWVHD